ncbi:GNAT family N-acetyltransferase [Acetobacter sacchari]|uniref:GNAT family N-acetyltransferase n=1 Tax=Acetobacter sacchari TaxID=2661687 RepID=A0ABS3LRX2_9PROT|nr:GNAT family N-acetyltransferase [Acetobacter sacchari]MBO1358661.1 GNAT family N-acetyltransferase [Acetobacter sacchari]
MNASEIRAATPDDLTAIATLWRESTISMDGGAPRVHDVEALRARLQSEGWRIEVVENDDRITGFLAVRERERVVDQLFVAPSAQGAGLGARLLRRAQALMPEGFTLRTPLSNLAGQRFYERHGLIMLRDEPHPQAGFLVRYYGWSP